jgi:hypothetical protein
VDQKWKRIGYHGHKEDVTSASLVASSINIKSTHTMVGILISFVYVFLKERAHNEDE